MDDGDFIKLIEAYIEFEESPSGSEKRERLFWTFEKFDQLNSEHPELCWKGLLEIINRIPADKIEGVMAAGILEDFIESNGSQFIDLLENEAGANENLKKLLGGVYECSTPEVWERVMKVRGEEW
jgi:hypothetical protein